MNHSRSVWKSAWGLREGLDFLNHGAFGACPLEVLAKQNEYRRQLEAQPLAYLYRELEARLDTVREELAAFIGADPAGLVFVNNATTGVNTVLRSLTLQPGDSILVTSHGYNACRNAVQFVVDRWQGKLQTAPIECPVQNLDDIVDSIAATVDETTRVAVIDHVTSPTGIVFPLEKILRLLKAREITVIVDGAHAPGMIPLNLSTLEADFYTGNCHKWMCSPKGAGFLYVARQWRERLRPLTISHGANSPRTDRSRLHLEFDWTGTGDPTAYLCVADALRFLRRFPGGIEGLMQHNTALARQARSLLVEKCGLTPSVLDEQGVGSIASVVIPERAAGELPSTPLGVERPQQLLLDRFGIEVPVFPFPAPPRRMLRIAAQIYNDIEQYDYLAAALHELQLVGGGS